MIQGLEQPPITEFSGKHTFNNLTTGKPGELIAATNVMVLDDNELRRAPGYTLVKAGGFALLNPNFVSGNSGWTLDGWNVVAGGANGSPYSAQWSTNGGSGNLQNNQNIPCNPGEILIAIAQFNFAVGSSRNLALVLNFAGVSGYISGVQVADIAPTVAGEYVSASVMGTAPSGTTYAYITVNVTDWGTGSVNVGGFMASLLPTNVAGPVQQIYDFQRDVDNKQFVFVQSGGVIYAMQADGTGSVALATGETVAHQFVDNAFACYSSNGVNAYRYVDVAGTLTKYNWGIQPPSTAPSVAVGSGSLTLTYGRTYVYCYVSRYTDSLGIQRLSISSPSPTSAFSGPVVSGSVNLTSIAASTDPQVNYIWIFEVTDSAINTSATYFFAAEIANGTTSYGDTLPDTALDQTRVAPFENFAAPPAPILEIFQNRIFAANGSLIQFSGYSEITIGIPEESWPAVNFFNVPSGKRTVNAMITQTQGSILSMGTEDWWYNFTGYNAATFTEQDRVASPGPCGPLAVCNTPFGVAYLSRSQQLWLWRSGGQATDISKDIASTLPGTYGMEDIDPTTIQNSIVRWFQFGKMSLLLVFCRTKDAPDQNLNLVQLWSIVGKAEASSGQYLGSSTLYEQIGGIFQTDKIPTVPFTNAARVEVDGEYYIFAGDANGNVYRFPDGFLDNGTNYSGNATLAWLLPREGKSRFYWIDLFTSRSDAVSSFQVSAITSEAPDPTLTLNQLSQTQLPSPVNGSDLAVRASLQGPGTASGRYLSVNIAFPADNADGAVLKVVPASAPLYVGVP